MHFEVLVEDSSGKEMLKILLEKITDSHDTYNVISYKGIGHIPKNMKSSTEANKRILLNQLPGLIRGYGNKYKNHKDYPFALIIVCDLDNKNLSEFLAELKNILNSCNPSPITKFCLAIEEGEAWLPGDIEAIKTAYPKAKLNILNSYENDSICGTWELLANGIYPGGVTELKKKGFYAIGKEKSNWAKNITPEMTIDQNRSPSFNHFKDTILKLKNGS